MSYNFGGHNNGLDPVPQWAILQRRKSRPRWGITKNGSATPTLAQVADTDSLLAAYDCLHKEGGQTAGPDGLTYDALSRSEAAMFCRTLAGALRQGTYRPGPGRHVKIPKTNGGHRTLTIRSIFDRVVANALSIALTPMWEKVFLPASMGFRPGVGAWNVLAAVESVVLEQDRNFLAIDDVRKAFDFIVIADVVKDHHIHLQDPALLALTEVVLRGSDGATRTVGIDQGSPYSPVALNVRLHYLHDVALLEDPTSPPWFRYADNLAYLCQDESEGNQVLNRIRQSLQVGGLTLKGEDGGTADLREGSVQLLGFTLSRKEDRIVFSPGRKALDGLRQNLIKAHEGSNPPLIARQIAIGWLTSLGPAFESCSESTIFHDILRVAADYGFREIGTIRSLRTIWRRSWENWLGYRETGRYAYQGISTP
jgi:RNA-directed DNA polymerase